MLFPQAVQGKVMSSHFTPASVSVQVINWFYMFALYHEVTSRSDYHRCCLPNNNESIPFIFMESSVFDHLPLLSKVSSSQGHITGSASPANGSAWLQLFCAHGQVSPWYEEVPTLLWKGLLQSICSAVPQTQRRNDDAQYPLCSTMDCHNSDEEQKTKRKKEN